MQDATDFGIVLRELMARHNLGQGKLAKKLGVSSAILSNYITGKNIPEMKLVAKCIKNFDLKDKYIKEIFYKYFLSVAKQNDRIIIDTQFLKPERIDLLVKFLTVLLLYPHDNYTGQEEKTLNDLNQYLDAFSEEICYVPPAD